MADLKDTAEQFVKDLTALNLAGLMMTFTPEGLNKALAMQAQMQAGGGQQPVTSSAVELLGTEGDDHVVDLVLTNPNGSVTIGTRWREVLGAWKVNDIGIKA